MQEEADKKKYDGVIIAERPESVIMEASKEEVIAVAKLEKSFLNSLNNKEEDQSVEEWLSNELKKQFPDRTEEELESLAREITGSIQTSEEQLASLHEAQSKGISKESWFADSLKTATSNYSALEASKYLQNLDTAVENANEALCSAITRNDGMINMNRSLDGFIAEEYHAQTFNMNAEATGSPYRARVLGPGDHGYTKNSVDIVIQDEQKHIVRKYQVKYYKNAAETEKAFNKGDYQFQRKLVPEGQEGDVSNATDHIEAPDGTSSNSLTKEHAKQMQDEAQSGNWNDLNWNEYKTKDIAIGIGKQCGKAALLGAAIGAGSNLVIQLQEGEGVDAEEILKSAAKTGGEFGVKAAIAGAVKTASEKGIIHIIPKGIPAATIAEIVHIAHEDVKVLKRVADGELTLAEGMDEMGSVTASTVVGIAAAARGGIIGAQIGAVLGPIGVAVGGFIGSTIGYISGSEATKKVISVSRKVRDYVVPRLQNIGKTVARVGEKLVRRTSRLLNL